MKVKMLKTMAGPTGTACANSIVDLPQLVAQNLIEIGAAVAINKIAERVEPEPEVETATRKPILEKAVTRRRGKTKRVSGE